MECDAKCKFYFMFFIGARLLDLVTLSSLIGYSANFIFFFFFAKLA